MPLRTGGPISTTAALAEGNAVLSFCKVRTVEIYLDGRSVGTAEEAHLDLPHGKVCLTHLDAVAGLFFATTMGAGGCDSGHDAPLGWVAVDDGLGQWIEVPSARVFSFSSGTGEVVLISGGLRIGTDSPGLSP